MSSFDKYIRDDPTYAHLHKLYTDHQQMFWVAHEVDPSKDMKDWNSKLSESEKHFIKRILTFFSVADGIVNENITSKFMKDAEYITEAKNFYSIQCSIEKVHEEVYKKFIHTYFVSEDEKQKVFNDVITCSSINKKVTFVEKWMNADRPFDERLIAFAVVEGILFSSSFCAIYYMKNRGLLQQLTLSNEWISRDEALHTVFSCELFKTVQKLKSVNEMVSKDLIRDIVIDGVDTEMEFVREAFSLSNEGVTTELMEQYVKCVADNLLKSLGCNAYYNAVNPFPWMLMMAVDGKTNFFERVVTEYKKIKIPNFEDIQNLM